jgi:hypothetical protein
MMLVVVVTMFKTICPPVGTAVATKYGTLVLDVGSSCTVAVKLADAKGFVIFPVPLVVTAGVNRMYSFSFNAVLVLSKVIILDFALLLSVAGV